jgi:hypothetical protein
MSWVERTKLHLVTAVVPLRPAPSRSRKIGFAPVGLIISWGPKKIIFLPDSSFEQPVQSTSIDAGMHIDRRDDTKRKPQRPNIEMR